MQYIHMYVSRDVVQRTEGQGEVGCIKIGKNELEGMLVAGGLMTWAGLKNSIWRSGVKDKQQQMSVVQSEIKFNEFKMN